MWWKRQSGVTGRETAGRTAGEKRPADEGVVRVADRTDGDVVGACRAGESVQLYAEPP